MNTYSYYSKKSVYVNWEITISYEPIDENRRYRVYNYKNIGTFTEEPEDLSDMDGFAYNRFNKFSRKEIEWINNDVFRFGKYNNRKIDEVNDIKYTCWYFTQIGEEHKEWVRQYLYDHWCDFRTNEEGEEYAVTRERIKKEEEWKKARERKVNSINFGRKHILIPDHNPNADGKLRIDGITYVFPKVVENYYRDIVYYLPVQNGKVKRIKNKKLECSLMELDGDIYISNFKVIK